ncbi:magnesium/cobalt transporter CorA [Teichococcus vastitatis]|jgi:magnesium transporter|uniref:Magnesium transport protein CorA n=1 Tax=Teichococcus vastitatis TaxID=2307076 RepID=A0ABS9W6U7_9PROT|nr:magnesium/cobalt transporter CorA [Pseudoroseomonas vastitatis]MCI0754630.1 magnesium/cobalt transporter CorA [Pseudoroseomonas vastitatis]
MTVVAAFLYRDGHRAGTVKLDQPSPCSGDRSEFVWIGLLEPTEAELRTLQDTYGLHPLAVEDALKAHQLPKVDVYGDQLFVVARTAHLENDQVEYGETAIFVGRNHIITVRHGSARHHATLRAQLEAAPKLLAQGVDYVLHGVLDFVVDGYIPIMETIEEEVLEMERCALDSMLQTEAVTRIFHLRRQMIRFGRILEPMAELCSKLVRLDMPCIDHDARPYFSDVLDHVRRVQTRVGGLREILTSVFEISSLLEQQRQGAITRQLAAWAAILAVPTAIAGIYGMNFENMPELRSQYGYFVVLGVIATLCGLLYWRFRKARWL